MSEKLKYKVGDELLVRAKILEVDGKTTRYPYLLSTSGWLRKEELDRITVEVPQKPKVTQAVMVWYEENKDERVDWTLRQWLSDSFLPEEVSYWLYGDNHLDHQHAIVTLITYGPEAVEVEKEKKYRVLIKDELVLNSKLVKNPITNMFEFVIGDHPDSESFTKQELIDAGFGDVFDNEMFEVEEVE